MKQRKAMHKADGNVSASLLARDVSGRIVCGARHSEMKERERRNRAGMAEGAKTCRARGTERDGARHSEMKERKRRNRASMAEGAKTCRVRSAERDGARMAKPEKRKWRKDTWLVSQV